MTGGLHLPGPGGVPDLGAGQGVPQQPSVAEVLAAQIVAVQQQVDMLFQAMMRLHSGWTAEQVIEDMQLNVAPVPGTEPFEPPTALREAVEAVVADDPPPNRETRRAAAKAARPKGKK